MQPTINVIQADSSGNAVNATIANPLYSYVFNSAASQASFSRPFNQWKKTVRNPTSSGVTREAVADANMQSGFATRKRATFNSFSRGLFNQFSSAIENVHDDVHANVGGGGHMSYIPYSAFDPIFWLHHVNVDRLTAMYQASSPGVVLQSGSAVGTFARPAPPATVDDINTPLYPFRRADMSWWTSVDTSSASTTWSNGYGYPEVPCSYSAQSASALDAYTTTQINTLYGSSSIGVRSKSRKRASGVQSIEWDAKIVIDQSELFGSFVVYIYLGTPESDPNLWPTSGKEVGTLSSLGFPDRKKKSAVRSAIVPLTPILEERGIEGTREEISAYLARELTWVVLSNKEPVDVKSLKTLKVAVTGTEIITPDRKDKLPVWGQPSYYFNATSGKIGGAETPADVENPILIDGKRGKPATG